MRQDHLGARLPAPLSPSKADSACPVASATAVSTHALHSAITGDPRRRRPGWPTLVLLVGLPLVATLLVLLLTSPANTAPMVAERLVGVLGQMVQSPMFWLAVLVGFSAQVIDGALGMAYGISATTFLMGLGASPAAASAATHVAEVFTTGASGAAHWRLGNIDGTLFRRIVVPGALGSVAGAYVLTSIDGRAIKPYVAAYLLALGLYILSKAWRGHAARRVVAGRQVQALAATGGFLDAAGGGGWGPVVTSSLVGRGHEPRTTIGTVNAAEFFVALAAGGAFLVFGAVSHGELIAGLVFGGLFAAPLGAWLTRSVSPGALLWLVGGLVSLISGYNLWSALR